METLDDISIPNDQWVDINTASGIAVGALFDIQNKTTIWVQLYEGDTAPSLDETSGRLLTNLSDFYGIATILAGSKRIWAKARPQGGKTPAVVSVQVL